MIVNTLSDDQIAGLLPRDNSWPEILRFYCQTSSPTDPNLPFMASMWSYAIAHHKLSGKQAESAWQHFVYRLGEVSDSAFDNIPMYSFKPEGL